MTYFGFFMLVVWPAVVLGAFALLPARRAVIVAFIGAWLFLPMGGYRLPGVLEYTKLTAACVGVMLGAMIFDPRRLAAFSVSFFDIPMFAWCLCPMASSINNGLGVYDGTSAMVSQTITWGLPYVVGRIYFADLSGLRDLVLGIFIGGLAYVPLCLYEIRMSPQLHVMIYGFHQHEFIQHVRYGGYRPMVFMQHGLAVGMWMTSASLVGCWLWMTGSLRRCWGVPMSWLVLVLLATAVLCKSTGAIVLLFVGLLVLGLAKWGKNAIPLTLVVAAAPLYMAARVSGTWAGGGVVSLASAVFGEQRAESLQVRIVNEDLLTVRAMERPVFGWGGWGGARVRNEFGRDVSVTDGLWIIALGNYGVVGLVAITSVLLLPGLLLLCRCPPDRWSRPEGVALSAIAVLLALYMLDCIANAMINPIFILAIGGTVGATSTGLPPILRYRKTQEGGPDVVTAESMEVRSWTRRVLLRIVGSS